MSNDDVPDQVTGEKVNFLLAQPTQDAQGGNHIALSFETSPRGISSLLITHAEAHTLLGDLLDSMASQGCEVAEFLIGALRDVTDQEENEESLDSDVEEDSDDEGESIDADFDDYGPEK